MGHSPDAAWEQSSPADRRGPGQVARLYWAVSPPSMTNSLPVTKADSSEARYRTPQATSSGWPSLPSGWRAILRWRPSALASIRAVIGVSMTPGWTDVHRMPSLAYCTAVALVRKDAPPPWKHRRRWFVL